MPLTQYSPSPHATATSLDDDSVVVLHVKDQSYYELNATAGRLWRHLVSEAPATEEQLVGELLRSHDDVSKADVVQDVKTFLASMAEADLIETEE